MCSFTKKVSASPRPLVFLRPPNNPVRSTPLFAGDGVCNPTSGGHQYVGHTSVTESGKQCQAWASQSPHAHMFTADDMYPDGSITDASNYCRNPDSGWNGGVWCLTTDPDTRWETCDVPVCGQLHAMMMMMMMMMMYCAVTICRNDTQFVDQDSLFVVIRCFS